MEVKVELELQTLVSHHCGHWEHNLGPLQEQYILLTLSPPSSLLVCDLIENLRLTRHNSPPVKAKSAACLVSKILLFFKIPCIPEF